MRLIPLGCVAGATSYCLFASVFDQQMAALRFHGVQDKVDEQVSQLQCLDFILIPRSKQCSR